MVTDMRLDLHDGQVLVATGEPPSHLMDLNSIHPLTDLEKRAFGAMIEMENNPAASAVIAQYGDTLESGWGALRTVESVFNELKGSHLIALSARINLNKQSNTFLIAAKDVIDMGKAQVLVFGESRIFTTLDEIVAELKKIQDDFDRVAELKPSYDEFAVNGLPLIDKYLFDNRNLEAVRSAEVSFEIAGEYDGKLRKSIQQLCEADKMLPYTYQSDHQPDVIVVSVKNRKRLVKSITTIKSQMIGGMWFPFVAHRPMIIAYVQGFEPSLGEKAFCGGDVLFCTDENTLKETALLAKDISLTEKNKPKFLDLQVLITAQEQLYDNSN